VNVLAKNLTDQVRDIATVTTAVAKGDLTQKVKASCKGEILQLKSTINSMVDQLRQFAQQVTKIAKEVGTDGILGGQAEVRNVEGTWADLTQSVVSFPCQNFESGCTCLLLKNQMAQNLTIQVREIAEVTTAVAKGDLSRKVEADVKGEILSLKITMYVAHIVHSLPFAFPNSSQKRDG